MLRTRNNLTIVWIIKLNPKIFNKLKEIELSIPMVAIGMIIYKNKLLIFRD